MILLLSEDIKNMPAAIDMLVIVHIIRRVMPFNGERYFYSFFHIITFGVKPEPVTPRNIDDVVNIST